MYSSTVYSSSLNFDMRLFLSLSLHICVISLPPVSLSLCLSWDLVRTVAGQQGFWVGLLGSSGLECLSRDNQRACVLMCVCRCTCARSCACVLVPPCVCKCVGVYVLRQTHRHSSRQIFCPFSPYMALSQYVIACTVRRTHTAVSLNKRPGFGQSRSVFQSKIYNSCKQSQMVSR